MRIVDVCAFYTPAGGGVKTYVERKLQAGPPAGHEIVILAPGTENRIEEVAPGAIIATIAAAPFPLDRNYHYFDDEARLHAALDQWRPDLVEVASPWTSASMVGRWRGNAPRALIMHCDFLSAYPYRWLQGLFSIETIDRQLDWYWRHLRKLDRQFDFVVSASNDLTLRLRAGGVGKAQTIPMGVQPGVFSPALRSEALRAEMLAQCDLPPDATLLVGLGRMAPEKRWPMICEAVLAAGSHHAVGLVLFGAGRDRARVIRATRRSPHITIAPAMTDRDQLARLGLGCRGVNAHRSAVAERPGAVPADFGQRVRVTVVLEADGFRREPIATVFAGDCQQLRRRHRGGGAACGGHLGRGACDAWHYLHQLAVERQHVEDHHHDQ